MTFCTATISILHPLISAFKERDKPLMPGMSTVVQDIPCITVSYILYSSTCNSYSSTGSSPQVGIRVCVMGNVRVVPVI